MASIFGLSAIFLTWFEDFSSKLQSIEYLSTISHFSIQTIKVKYEKKFNLLIHSIAKTNVHFGEIEFRIFVIFFIKSDISIQFIGHLCIFLVKTKQPSSWLVLIYIIWKLDFFRIFCSLFCYLKKAIQTTIKWIITIYLILVYVMEGIKSEEIWKENFIWLDQTNNIPEMFKNVSNWWKLLLSINDIWCSIFWCYLLINNMINIFIYMLGFFLQRVFLGTILYVYTSFINERILCDEL